MYKRMFAMSIAAGACIVVAQTALNGLAISINGKRVSGKTLVSKGETYVPMSALKAAGVTATVKSGTMHLSWTGAGGANQVQALEGKVGDWLFNGIWRFRVMSVGPTTDGRAGWIVKSELRNGTKLDNVALGGTGFDSLKLAMADGNSLSVYNITDIADRPLGQGASAVVDLVFYDDDGGSRKPEKLILRITPDESTKRFLKQQGAAYSVADPSFRVILVP